MTILGLQFYLQKNKERMAHVEIDLEGFGKREDSAVYIIKQSDLATLKELKDLFLDRGTKHPAKGLSRLLLGYQKVPFISGTYRTTGQLTRSLRTLLENASEKGEKNKYIVGIDEPIFRQLWDEAERAGTAKERGVGADEIGGGVDSSSQILWDLLPHCEEPAELAQRFIGNSLEVRLVRQLILRAGQIDSMVLILGDTGTGKELVARSIHDYGKRVGAAYLPINCGAISPYLLESELFGHKKGAFTHAAFDKMGMWEMANGGTLFLDEIGDLPIEHQSKILRALEDGKIRPVGATKEIEVNARIITATNKDLHDMVQKGQFREDLYYRLRGFLIHTPALRDHPDDIPILAQTMWHRITNEEYNSLPQEIIQELQYYRWPGNVRDLKTILARMKGYFGTTHLGANHLKAVFLMDGHMYLENKPSSAQESAFLSLDSVSHLRQAEEILRAAEKVCRPFIKAKKAGAVLTDSFRDLVQYRIDELEALCSKPTLFSSETLFSEVHNAKGKLIYFRGLLEKDRKKALSYLKKEVTPGLDRTLQKVAQQIRTIAKTDQPAMSFTT